VIGAKSAEKQDFCWKKLFQRMGNYFPLRCQPNISGANTTLTWILSNKIKLVTWHPRQITIGYCDWSGIGHNSFPGMEIYFPFRCQPNKSGATTARKYMLSNEIKLVKWHPRQITLGYFYWIVIGWLTSFCAHNPFPDMEIYFPFMCQPDKLCANNTLDWMLSNRIKLVTWHPRQIH